MSAITDLTVNVTPGFSEVQTTSLASPASSVSFTGLTGKLYRVSMWGECTASAKLKVRVNNDSAGNYDVQVLVGASTTVDGARSTADSGLEPTNDFIAADGMFTLVVALGKQLTSAKGMMVSSLSFFGDYATDAISAAVASCVWNNTADLITRIDVVASAGNLKANTLVVLTHTA